MLKGKNVIIAMQQGSERKEETMETPHKVKEAPTSLFLELDNEQ